MSLIDKIKKSSFWQTLEVVALVVTQFTYFSVMARLLSKSDFGLMAITNSLAAVGYILAESGMGAALIQKKKLSEKHINAALQGAVLVGVILSLIFLLFAPVVANFFEQTELLNLIRVISLNFIFLAIGNVSIGLLHKNFRFKESSIVTIGSVVIAYSMGVYLGILGYGVWSLVVAVLLNSLLKSVGYLWFAPVKISIGFYMKEWKELFSFGFGMILLKLSNYAGYQGVNLFLGKIFSPSLLGVFERSFMVKTLPSSYLGNIVDRIMFPTMSEIQDEKEKLFNIFQQSLGLVNSILMPITLILVFFTKEVVLILMGNNWLEAVSPLRIMFLVLPLSISVRMADSVVRAKGMVYRNAWRKFLYVVVLLTSVSFGAIYYGLNGAAWGVTISYVFNFVTMLFLVKKIFTKNIIDIFITPMWAGAKLTIYIALFLVCSTTLLGMWQSSSVLYFIVILLVIVTIAGIMIYKKPKYLGKYIEYSVIKLFDN